jgi:hypothetical protein
MLSAPCLLKGAERLVEAFGYWPTFHDAPVLRFQAQADLVEIDLETWEMTSQVDSRGFFVLTKRHEVGFRFKGLIDTDLSQFIPENILSRMTVSPIATESGQSGFHVALESAIGSEFCGSFRARTGELAFVRPIPAKAE